MYHSCACMHAFKHIWNDVNIQDKYNNKWYIIDVPNKCAALIGFSQTEQNIVPIQYPMQIQIQNKQKMTSFGDWFIFPHH